MRTSILSLVLATLSFASALDPGAGARRSRERRQAPDWRHRSERESSAFNVNPSHPHLSAIKRGGITADASSVAGQTFDFVIVGGGLAGLVVGSRLSEWSNVTVLVIEAGGDGSDVLLNEEVPGYSYIHGISNGTPYGWNFTSTNLTGCDMQTKHIPLGRGLGGSGAVNGMFWCRGDSVEYDAWGSLNPGGNQTWDWTEVNKYIMKAENLTEPTQYNKDTFQIPYDTAAHGSGGPLQIGWSQYIWPSVANWVPTWVALGFQAKDLAAGDTHGVTITPSTLDANHGQRSDSKTAYLDPNTARTNLVVLTGQQGTKILFNGTKDTSGNVVASGVQFQSDAAGTSYTVNANKEVIVTAGTVNTPKVLQLSGIGPASVLAQYGISSVVDIPVGYNYQDHVSYAMYWNTTNVGETWYELATNTTLQAEAMTEWENSRTGRWTYINEAVGYVDLADIAGGNDAAAAAAATIDIPTVVSTLAAQYNLPASVQAGLTSQLNLQKTWLTDDVGQFEIIMHLWGKTAESIGIQVALQHPWSRGTLFIASADPFEMPVIDPNYFAIDFDVQMMSNASGWVRDKLTATAPLNAVLTTEDLPGTAYTGDTLTTYFKTAAGTEYHPIGTCSMLPRDQGGVVDTNLIVYGTSNLRVLDSSIIPIHVSAHTMASTYGVAEKGADIIKQQHMYVPPVVSSTTHATASGAATTSAAGTGETSQTSKAHDSATTSGLSTGAKAGIGIGAALGAVAIIAVIATILARRKTAAATENHKSVQYVQQGGNNDRWMDSYPMTAQRPYAGQGHGHSGSVSTMATADLHPGQNRY